MATEHHPVFVIEIHERLSAPEFLSWFSVNFYEHFPVKMAGSTSFSPFLCEPRVISSEYPINIQIVAYDNKTSGLAHAALEIWQLQQRYTPLGEQTTVAEIIVERQEETLILKMFLIEYVASKWLTKLVKALLAQLDSKVVTGHLALRDKKRTETNTPDDIDLTIIELWKNRKTAKEIGVVVNMQDGSVANKIVALRKKYGASVVPYRRKPKHNKDVGKAE